MGTAFDAYLDWLSGHYRAATLVIVTLFLGLGAGMTGLSVTNDMRAYFSSDNPQLLAFERLERIFDRQDVLFLIVVPDDGDIFDRDTLTLIYELTEGGWQAPYSRRVASLANYQHTQAVGDELLVTDLIGSPRELDDDRIAVIRQIALNEPDLVGASVAPSGSATAVQIRMTLPDEKLDANDEVMAWATGFLASLRDRYPQVTIYVGGTVAGDVDLGRAVARDVSELVSFSYIVIIVGLIGLLRHALGTAATLLIITFAISGTMGIYGWLGFVLEAVSGFVPSVVMTIAVADSVHVMTSYYHEVNAGKEKFEAVREALRVNLKPVFVTSITTAVGVLMLNFSDSPPYHDLGNLVAIGVMLAWFLSMSLLPALLMWFPVPSVSRSTWLASRIVELGEWVIRNRRSLFIGFGGAALVIGSFIPRNKLTEDWNNYFDDTFEVRRASNALREHFGSLHSLRYIIDSGTEHGIDDPDFIAQVQNFADWMRAQPEVKHVSVITDLLKRLNMNLHADDPAWRKLPDERGMVAQYLLLYEMSLPLGQGLEDTINVDRSATQLTASLAHSDSESLIAFDRRARRWLAAHAPGIQPTEATGIDMIFAHMNHRNIRDLLRGVGAGIVGIAVLLIFALQSVRLGLLSLLTNLAPATLAYGTWGLCVGEIDISASVVMCMSLGIVVDDTVHFMSKYRYARYLEGGTVEDALRYAFRTVGLALVVTTIVLVAGFAVLSASHFTPSVRTGTLMAVTLSYALLIDFFVLPPLLMIVEGGSGGAAHDGIGR
jgi:uncharacterized protein